MASEEHVLFRVEEGVGVITLNRPDRLNAIVPQLRLDVVKAFREADRDDEVQTIILTGSGRGFCAGRDLRAAENSPGSEMTPEQAAVRELKEETGLDGSVHSLIYDDQTAQMLQSITSAADEIGAAAGILARRPKLSYQTVVAMDDDAIIQRIQALFSSGLFRVYRNTDVVGCELGGAVYGVGR